MSVQSGSGDAVSPLRIPLGLSLSLRFAAMMAHVLPCAAAMVPGVAIWARVFVILAAIASAAYLWRQQGARRGAYLEVRSSGVTRHANGEVHVVGMTPDCVDLGWLIVLRWQDSDTGQRARCALTRDALGAEQWRRLRIWLRWHAQRTEEQVG